MTSCPFRPAIPALVLAAALLASAAPGPAASPPPSPQARPAARTPAKVDTATFAARHREFLTLVTYIITDKEKEVFLQLTNDKDRDIFIESFWRLRDPTAGTPENEFRVEHIRRFNHATKTFGRGVSRPGWMTDRGKFYIILGEPNTTDRFDSTLGIVPCEVWYYYTDGTRNLPLHFGLVFFQKGGVGELRLYDPVTDGPKTLLTNRPGVLDLDPQQYEAIYDQIFELAPTLADMSISLIPGEYGYGYTPSTRSLTLLASIAESPKASIRPSYATHFLDYKGLVSTEYMTNFIEAETAVAVLVDPVLRIPFIHFTIKPAHVSVDYYEPKDQYFSAYTVSVSLRRPGAAIDETIFQYTKDFPFYFDPSEADRIQANGVAIEDAFPAFEGTYKLTILLQNSVAKEFSLDERDVTIPAEDGRLRVSAPLFGYKFQDYGANIMVPFKLRDKKLIVDPKSTFARQDTLAYMFSVENAPEALWREGTARVVLAGTSNEPDKRRTFEHRLRDLPYGPSLVVTQGLAARDLPPEYYEAEVTVLDGQGTKVASARGQFILASAESLGHPIARAKGFSLDNRFLFYGMLGQQAAKAGAEAKADAFYKRAFALKPDFTKGLAEYAQFLLKAGRFDDALAAADRFKADTGLAFEQASVRGRALLGKELYADAIPVLLEANRIYNSDVGVLNALGFCFFKQGQKKEALDSLRASLKLNPDQPEAKALLAEVEKIR
jgi:GWxTD domain-containing protein